MSTGDAIRMPAPIEGTITEIEPAKDGRPPLLMLTVPAREVDPAMLRFFDEVKQIGRGATLLGPVVAADEGGVTIDLIEASPTTWQTFDQAERIARGAGR